MAGFEIGKNRICSIGLFFSSHRVVAATFPKQELGVFL